VAVMAQWLRIPGTLCLELACNEAFRAEAILQSSIPINLTFLCHIWETYVQKRKNKMQFNSQVGVLALGVNEHSHYLIESNHNSYLTASCNYKCDINTIVNITVIMFL
jgi:hypothetical protein